MNFPGFILGLIISSLYGAVFHFWVGGKAGKLLLYLILAWAGFIIGHLLGNATSFTFARLGQLNLGPATIGSIILLGLGHWLSLVETQETS